MKTRNWHAVNAHFRQAGSMKHRNTPRGGAKNQARELLAEARVEWERVNWLCGCGNGRLSVPESEVPAFCGLCGSAVKGDE